MMSRKVVKIICIILAALMALSALVALTQVFAVDLNSPITPATGENDMDVIIPVVLLVAAVGVVAFCLILPKLKKKDKTNRGEENE